MFNQLTLNPYMFPYNNTSFKWDVGLKGDSYDPITDGYISVIPASYVSNLTQVGDSIDLTSYLELPTRFPFNNSRILNLATSSADTEWANFDIVTTYKNAYGWFMSPPAYPFLASPAGSTFWLAQIGMPFPSGTDVSNRFFYVNELISLKLVRNATGSNPVQDIYISFYTEGMNMLNLQDSTRYNSGSLQVLTQNNAGNADYSAYIDNYPFMVSQIPPVFAQAFLATDFYSTSDKPFTGISGATPLPFPLAQLNCLDSTPFEITGMVNATDSQLARIPFAVGNLRVEVSATNAEQLFVSLIQNSTSF